MTDGNSGSDVTCDCVFCGWSKAKLYPQRKGSHRRTGENWQVVCNRCRARGPLSERPDDAVSLWTMVSAVKVA